MSSQPRHRDPRTPDSNGEQPLSKEDAASYLLEECRMVLPGIQALFGFQLIAVFNEGFAARLSKTEQEVHLAALVLVVVAVALVMAPAALHRQREPHGVSDQFLHVSSRLLLWSMLPLAVGICLDVYLVSRIITDSASAAGVLAGGLFAVIIGLWFVLPRRRVLRKLSSA